METNNTNWIPVEKELPPVETKVIVARPNPYSGKVDIILGYLHEPELKGRTYGHAYDSPQKVTYGHWWSFPAVAPLEAVTHWQFPPSPPPKH